MLPRILVGTAIAFATSAVFARAGRTTCSRRLSQESVMLIDWMRGLAAVAVLLGHVRGLFMQDYEALRRPSLLWKAFYAVSGLGHQAVIVFFILSGFLVGSTVLAQTSERRWHFRDYFARRLVRLYTVLVPGLLLTAAWDGLGLHLFGADGIYGGHLSAAHLTMPDVRVTLSIGHFLGNLAFLQHLFIAPFGTNGPLWSLSYEFWAYLLFPLLVLAGTAGERRSVRVVFGLLAAGILSAGGYKLDLYFVVWLMGAGLACWFRRAQLPTSSVLLKALAWLCFTAAVLLGRSSRLSDWYADPILGVATALLLGVALRDGPNTSPATTGVLAAWLAGFSYTLYVVHYPLLSFFYAAVMDGARWAPSGQAVVFVGLMTVAIFLGYAYPISRLTEAHTESLRRRLVRKRPSPLAAPASP